MAKLWHEQQWRGTVSMSLQSELLRPNLYANRPSNRPFQKAIYHRPSFPSWTSRVRSPSPAFALFWLVGTSENFKFVVGRADLESCFGSPNCGEIVAGPAASSGLTGSHKRFPRALSLEVAALDSRLGKTPFGDETAAVCGAWIPTLTRSSGRSVAPRPWIPEARNGDNRHAVSRIFVPRFRLVISGTLIPPNKFGADCSLTVAFARFCRLRFSTAMVNRLT